MVLINRVLVLMCIAALMGVTLIVISPEVSSAARCQPGQSGQPGCNWTGGKNLHFASGPVTYGSDIGSCNYTYDIAIGQKRAESYGTSACDHFRARIYYGVSGWAGWSTWSYGMTNASKTVTGSPVQSHHNVDPWK